MNRHLGHSLLIVTISITCPAAAFAESVIYRIEQVSLSGGYAIDGGFITTNGVLGQLSASDILDYEVHISGPLSFVFRPSGQSASTNISGQVIATATSIFIPVAPDPPVGERNQLSFAAMDNLPPECNTCTQTVTFAKLSSVSDPSGGTGLGLAEPVISFFNSGLPVGDLVTITGGGTLRPLAPLTVATVPEPTAFMSSLLGICGSLVARRRILSRPK
jgi:hypothetical protein